jgi:hypothetical protein
MGKKVANVTEQAQVITLAPKQQGGKKQVIPAQIHAAAAALVQRLAEQQTDITGLIAVAGDFAQLQSKLLELQPASTSDYALAELVPEAVRPNGIASAQSVRCKSFKAASYTTWLQAAYEEIILRHGYKAAKASGTAIGLRQADVDDLTLEQVKRLLNSRASTKCITSKWPDGAEKAARLAKVEADIELLTARRKALDPTYGSRQGKVPKPSGTDVLAAAGISAESEQGQALLQLLQLTV